MQNKCYILDSSGVQNGNILQYLLQNVIQSERSKFALLHLCFLEKCAPFIQVLSCAHQLCRRKRNLHTTAWNGVVVVCYGNCSSVNVSYLASKRKPKLRIMFNFCRSSQWRWRVYTFRKCGSSYAKQVLSTLFSVLRIWPKKSWSIG